MNDVKRDPILRALDEGFSRDAEQAEECRREIGRKGTYWAGEEIWKLRRRVITLQQRVKDMEVREGGKS